MLINIYLNSSESLLITRKCDEQAVGLGNQQAIYKLVIPRYTSLKVTKQDIKDEDNT